MVLGKWLKWNDRQVLQCICECSLHEIFYELLSHLVSIEFKCMIFNEIIIMSTLFLLLSSWCFTNILNVRPDEGRRRKLKHFHKKLKTVIKSCLCCFAVTVFMSSYHSWYKLALVQHKFVSQPFLLYAHIRQTFMTRRQSLW